MPRSSSEDTYSESILMSDGLENGSRGSSRPRSFTDEDDYYYDYPRTPQSSSLHRMLDLVGINTRRRKRDDDLHYSSSGEALHGLLARPGHRRVVRESRTLRKYLAVSTARKMLLFLPFFILILFGMLHVVESVLGGVQLLWDYDDDIYFLPAWGTPGHSGSGLVEYPSNATRNVKPIACHSHNDYWRRVPLFEALHWGCTSVEAEIWHFDDDLFVGHTKESLTRPRSLRNLYIDPLVELLDKMHEPGDFASSSKTRGVFDEDPDQTLVLLIDFKSEPYSTYDVLEQQLEPLRKKDYLTYHDGVQLHQRAVTVVGTGNIPFDLVRTMEKRREIFFDAPLELFWETPALPIVASSADDQHEDYATAMSKAEPNITAALQALGDTYTGYDGDAAFTPDEYNTTNTYYASTSFYKAIGSVWGGGLSAKQLTLIRGQIRGARRRGLKVRYWDTPQWPVSLRNYIWQVLIHEGVDMLNVDDLKAAATEDWRRRQHTWFT